MLDRLTMSPTPPELHGLVLMLHGGAEHSFKPVDHRSLALRRTRGMFEAISPTFVAGGIGVGLLRFVVKGWNAEPGNEPSPLRDARLAVRDLRQQHGDLPIVLLGHSMGARTAVAVADEPGVVGVVGLAPWFPADEPVGTLAGKQVVAVHGTRDRITSPKASRIFIERAAEVAQEARHISVPNAGHYMFSGVTTWNRHALRESFQVLERVSPAR